MHIDPSRSRADEQAAINEPQKRVGEDPSISELADAVIGRGGSESASGLSCTVSKETTPSGEGWSRLTLPRQEKILSALRKFFRNHAGSPERLDLVPLGGGLSDAGMYRFTYKGEEYVLRLLDQREASFRLQEIHIGQVVGASGMAPEVMDYDENGRSVIMRYVPGKAYDPEAHQLEALGKALRKMHELPVDKDSVSQERGPLAQIQTDLQRAQERIQVPPKLQAAIEDALGFSELYRAEAQLCHNDINCQNLLMTAAAEVILIDFTDSGLGNGLYDLAYFSVFTGLDQVQEHAFVQAYYGEATSPEGLADRLKAFKQLTRVRLAAWAIRQVAEKLNEGETVEEQFEHYVASSKLMAFRTFPGMHSRGELQEIKSYKCAADYAGQEAELNYLSIAASVIAEL